MVEETHEIPNEGCSFWGRDSNRVIVEYKSRGVVAELTCQDLGSELTAYEPLYCPFV
jgi:hypothetical protein